MTPHDKPNQSLVHLGFAALIAVGVVGAYAAVYYLTPMGAQAQVSEEGSCHDLAEWHFQQALADGSQEHLWAGWAAEELAEDDEECPEVVP